LRETHAQAILRILNRERHMDTLAAPADRKGASIKMCTNPPQTHATADELSPGAREQGVAVASAWRTIQTQRDGECRLCGGEIKAGETVRWHRSKGIEHERGGCTADLKPEYKETTEQRWQAMDQNHQPRPKAEDQPKRERLPTGEAKMLSQYDGSSCRVCKERINKGDEIAWMKGLGARHIGCTEVAEG
jgi:hypothetical protein